MVSIKAKAIGLDFGTTNSAIAAIGDDDLVALARFRTGADGASTDTMRSILFFDAEPQEGEPALSVGHDAIRHYMAAGGNGRLIQSLKSFLADRLFHQTN